mmetsp:Transcript_151640/g.275925  ORF Transcript_151640/g.275925 Transcript_151640/m.275925 type:complete len:140 (-) Transcript_151640:21-440(-)
MRAATAALCMVGLCVVAPRSAAAAAAAAAAASAPLPATCPVLLQREAIPGTTLSPVLQAEDEDPENKLGLGDEVEAADGKVKKEAEEKKAKQAKDEKPGEGNSKAKSGCSKDVKCLYDVADPHGSQPTVMLAESSERRP